MLIQKAVENMNSLLTVKYGVELDKVEEKSLESEGYRERYNTRLLSIVSKARARYESYERKIYQRKKKKLRVHWKLVKTYYCFRLEKKRKVILVSFTRAK